MVFVPLAASVLNKSCFQITIFVFWCNGPEVLNEQSVGNKCFKVIENVDAISLLTDSPLLHPHSYLLPREGINFQDCTKSLIHPLTCKSVHLKF